MVVLFTGMFRSGSTWAYNIARVAMLGHGRAVHGEYRDDIGAAVAQCPPVIRAHLIKTHRPDPAGRGLIERGACRTVCTYREPLECIASNIEAFGHPFDHTLDRAVEALEFLRFQLAAPDVLFVAYEDITDRPGEAVRAITDYLEAPVPPDEVEAIARHFSRANVADFTARFKDHVTAQVGPTEAWEGDTLFHTDHIRARPSSPEALLDAAQLGRVIERLGDFVDDRGRLRDELRRRLARPRG